MYQSENGDYLEPCSELAIFISSPEKVLCSGKKPSWLQVLLE